MRNAYKTLRTFYRVWRCVAPFCETIETHSSLLPMAADIVSTIESGESSKHKDWHEKLLMAVAIMRLRLAGSQRNVTTTDIVNLIQTAYTKIKSERG